MRARRGFISAETADFFVSVGILVFGLVAGGLVFVCAPSTKAAQQQDIAAEKTVEFRARTSRHASTFTHDNHWWVRTRAWSDYIVHHPDCPCQKPAEAE